MVDTDKHGGRNPLVDAAAELSLTRKPEPHPLANDDPRGEVTGWYDGSGPLPGPSGAPEPMPGSFEKFMRAFGDGGAGPR